MNPYQLESSESLPGEDKVEVPSTFGSGCLVVGRSHIWLLTETAYLFKLIIKEFLALHMPAKMPLNSGVFSVGDI